MSKLLLTEGFLPDSVIGKIEIFDYEEKRVTDLLASGQFTFSSKFRQEENGDLTLIELSLIPIARLSTTDFRLMNQEGARKIFGVNSIFVDWILNHSKDDELKGLFQAIQELDFAAHLLVANKNGPGTNSPPLLWPPMDISEAIHELRKKLISALIQLTIIAVRYNVTEEDVAKETKSLKEKFVIHKDEI